MLLIILSRGIMMPNSFHSFFLQVLKVTFIFPSLPVISLKRAYQVIGEAVTPPIVFPSESFFFSCPILHPSHPSSHSLLNVAHTFHFLHCHLISVRLRLDHIAMRRAIAIAYEVHITQIVLFNGLAPGLSLNASDGLSKV